MACWRCASVRVRVRVGVCVCVSPRCVSVCGRGRGRRRGCGCLCVGVFVGGMDCLHLETLAWQVGNLMCKMFDILMNINLPGSARHAPGRKFRKRTLL